MRTSRAFLDTNVLLYTFDTVAPEKQKRATEAIAQRATADLVVSTQVLQEFYVNATRKLRPPMSPEEATREVDALIALEVVPSDARFVRSAIDLAQRADISLWDALIVRAASVAGCEVLLSEDLNAGQVIDGVRIENPFDDVDPEDGQTSA